MSDMIKLLIVSTDLTLQAAFDKNNLPFVAIVTYGGRVSDKFVGGTENIEGGPYKVLIPSNVLEAKIKELAGRKVFSSEGLESHAHSIDVGEFTDAWTEPMKDPLTGEFVTAAKASGIFNRSKDPELVDKIIALARQGVLGFSYDVKEVRFDLQAVSGGEQVVTVSDFKWRGATVLKKEVAAYQMTQLAAMKKELEEDDSMDEKKLAELVAKSVQETMTSFKEDTIQPFEQKFETSMKEVTDRIEKLETKSGKFEESLEAVSEKLEKAPAKEPDGKPDGNKQKGKEEDDETGDGKVLSFEKLTAGIATSVKEAVVEGMKPVNEGITKLTESLEAGRDKNTRKSHGQETDKLSAGMLSKYLDGVEASDAITLDQLEAAKQVIKSTVKDKDTRISMLNELVNTKRQLIKQAQRGGGIVH